MKRYLIGTLSLVALSLLLTATGAAAQSAVQFNVPFACRVGTTQLPAGTYRIKAEGQSLIVIGNRPDYEVRAVAGALRRP